MEPNGAAIPDQAWYITFWRRQETEAEECIL